MRQIVDREDQSFGEAVGRLFVLLRVRPDFLQDLAVGVRRCGSYFNFSGVDLPLILDSVETFVAGFGIDGRDLLALL
jgi:hypothetical protein